MPASATDPARAADARRRERDDLVPPAGGLGEPAERALHVVPDPEERMDQRADVERDPHLRRRVDETVEVGAEPAGVGVPAGRDLGRHGVGDTV